MMFNLKFSDECSYSVEVGTLISAVRFFPTGTLIRGGTLISAVRVFPTGALIRGVLLIGSREYIYFVFLHVFKS